MREVETEPGDPDACKRREFFGGVPEEGVAGVDRGEVLEGKAGIGVAVEEVGECLHGGEPPARFVPAGVEDDRLRVEGVGGFERPGHHLLDVLLDLRERMIIIGGGGAGVDAVAVMGRVDDGRDAGRGDPVEAFEEELPGQRNDLHLDVPDCAVFVERREQGKRLFIVEAHGAAEIVINHIPPSGVCVLRCRRKRFE